MCVGGKKMAEAKNASAQQDLLVDYLLRLEGGVLTPRFVNFLFSAVSHHHFTLFLTRVHSNLPAHLALIRFCITAPLQ